jgi:uncharacterized membrane protein
MLRSHLGLLVIFSFCISVVFAALMREDVKEQAILAAKMFVGLVAAAIAIGWLMYPFPM